jgi:DNA-binding phage protein
MRHIHVYLTGSQSYHEIDRIEEYLNNVMKEEGKHHIYTLLHSGYAGAEEIATMIAETMGWNIITVRPIVSSLYDSHSLMGYPTFHRFQHTRRPILS